MSATSPGPGELSLYDALQPGVKDGSYSAVLQQDVSATGAAVAPVTQGFEVAGPRFLLDPSEIHARFPPVGATGPYEGTLASVTLSTRLLPWERDVPALADSVPWLALLVFEEGELLGDRGTGDYAQTLAVATLLADPSGPVRKPQLKAVTAAELAQRCRAITLDSALFVQIVPTAAELPLLAHVRSLDPGQSPVTGATDPGTFAVVLANRFPRPGDASHGQTAIAHLVSLEGFGDLLTGTAPALPSSGGSTQAQVQLVSLASWTFSCLADPAQTFTALAQNLSRTDGGTGAARGAGSLLLKLPVDEPAANATDLASQAQRRLAEGYVAAGYHASSGEDGFAWYRGPLIPVVPGPAPPPGAGFETASAAMAFDPSTGVFDHSLAAAWQLGRSLALSDEAFATALMRLRVQANASLESAVAGDPHAALGELFGSGMLEAVGRATVSGGVEGGAGVRAPAAPAAGTAGVAALRSALAAVPPTVDPTDADVQAVCGWLAQLELLVPVPLAHLVPDARMLGPETLRSFYVDPAWVGAAVDGALSIGVGTSRDLAVQAALTGRLRELAATAALAVRSTALGTPAPAAATGGWTGILVRSALVSGWPGLTVTASAGGSDVPLLRLDHVEPGLLLALFAGVPDTVILGEPYEGLSFGVDDTGHLVLRSLVAPVGRQQELLFAYLPETAGSFVRAGDQRVLNLRAGAGDLLSALATNLNVAETALGPAAVGLQLLNVPEHVAFSIIPTAETAT
jgi:hypothetical protein